MYITIHYIARTNVKYFHDYLMYVIALPIIILKHLFFTVLVAHKTMANKYESYRLIIPIMSSHFCCFIITKISFNVQCRLK